MDKQNTNLSYDLDKIFYPKYLFVSITILFIVIVVILDFWLYQEFSSRQEVLLNEAIETVSEEFNFDLLQIENNLLKFSKNFYLEDIVNKPQEEILMLLNLGFKTSNYIDKIKFIENKNNSKNTIDSIILPKLELINNRLFFIFETTVHSKKLTITKDTEQDNKPELLQLYIDLNKYINYYLKKQHDTFSIGFKFRIQVGQAISDYIYFDNNQYIKKIDWFDTEQSTVFYEHVKLIQILNILHHSNWQIHGYIKIEALQAFFLFLIKLSLLVIIFVLLGANFLYKKFYHLEWQKLNITKDKKYLQQRTEITLASIQDGVIITNATAQIVYVNYVIEKYLNINLMDIYFKRLEEVIPELALLDNMEQEHLKLHDLKVCVNQDIYFFDVQANKLFDDMRLYLGTAIFLHDLTRLKRDQERINYLAYHDDNTGLPNKLSLMDYYGRIIASKLFLDNPCKLFTIVINIASLKNINDTIGYENGDKTIGIFLDIINNYLIDNGSKNSLYRIGGDTFVVVLLYERNRHGKSSMLYATNFINNLILELNKPIRINEQDVYLQFYFGISIFPDNFKLESEQSEAPLLLRYSEMAMSEARKKGLNKYVFFSRDISASIQEGFTLENELRTAIRENSLELLFHSQIELQSNKLRGFEILVRWHRQNGEMVLPGTFIPLLEKSGLIVTVGDWILREACLQGVNLIKKNIKFQRIAVNISGLQLQTEHFVDRLNNILADTGFPKDKLELEITESILFDNTDKIIAILNKIRSEGICIALDDFGTGFSSLNYLKDLPLDYIKIDRVFVHSIHSGDTRLLEAILAIAKTMNLITIAEGVETESQVNFLRTHLCDIIQGYYISKPMTIENLMATFFKE